MRNKKLIIALTCAVVFGLVGAMSISSYLSNARANSNYETVVVAKVDIPLGSMIVAEQLSTTEFPRGSTPEGIFSAPETVAGRVAVTNIVAREPVVERKLAPVGSAAGLSSMIPEGYRAMTVRVDDVVGVSGFLMPGALVDVLTIINPPEKAMNQDPISKVVLQNIKVLANGQNIDRPKDERSADTVRAVTLQVTPAQTEKLALASSEGKLQLVMRNSIDQGDEQTKGADKKSLLSGDQAMLTPDAGITSQATKPTVRASSTFRREPMRAVLRPRAEVAPSVVNVPAAPRRPTVEMIEGAKKRTVDFP